MKVNELAQQAKISPHAVRFYARRGLLKAKKNPRNGYRQFSQDAITRLRFIRMAQCLGYTLAEIRELLERVEQGDNPCDLMEDVLRQRLHDHQRTIEALQQMQRVMQKALGCLEKRVWNTANVEALCAHFQALEGSH